MGTKKKTVQITADVNKQNVIDAPDDLNETQVLLTEVFGEIDNIYRNKELPSVMTGIDELDERLQGFRKGDINIIASRPTIGKTLLALTIFSNITSQGINSLYISFDKYEHELLKSILSIKSSINDSRFDTGFLTVTDFKALAETIKSVNDNSDNIFLKTFFNADLHKLKEYIKKKVNENKIEIVFIDYLTMIMPAPTYPNRWEQVAEISRSLKTMAMEFKIPFVVLCPIHRNVDVTPQINDLSESGSIEYEADRIIILYNKPKNRKGMDKINGNIISVYIAKNRRGPTAVFDLEFDYKMKTIKKLKSESTT